MKDLIRKHYSKADLKQITAGKAWYEDAHLETLLISEVFNVPHNVVIGVLSALSPRNKWARNVADTWSLIEVPSLDTKVCTFNTNKEKALAILSLIDPTDNDIKGILKGQKTCNFFDNIMNYDTSSRVTVDVWAFRSVGLEPSVKNFKTTEQAYIDVANELDMVPNQLQAVVWGIVRGDVA